MFRFHLVLMKQIQTERRRNESWDILIILLMAEIPNNHNHLQCMKPYKYWDILPYQLVSLPDFRDPSTV